MVSVIIPTYRRSEFLERAIKSVLLQSYQDIEIIVVDDNGKDTDFQINNQKIMNKYKNYKNIKYIIHEKNLNGAAARNSGINIAKGKYITFLDDDDFFLKNRIKELVTILENRKDFDAAYTGVIKIKDNKIRNIISASKEGNLKYEMLTHDSVFTTGSNIFLRASVFKDLQKFDEKFYRYQDLEFMVRFFRKYKIKAVSTYSIVKDDTSRINVQNQEKLYKMLELFLKKYEKDIESFENSKAILLLNYNKLYNKLCDKRVKRKIKQKLAELGEKPSINLSTIFKNNFSIIRDHFSIIRGKFSIRKLSPENKKEIFGIIGYKKNEK